MLRIRTSNTNTIALMKTLKTILFLFAITLTFSSCSLFKGGGGGGGHCPAYGTSLDGMEHNDFNNVDELRNSYSERM